LLRDGIQSALNPHSPAAALIAEISWALIIGGGLVFAVVIALAAWAVLRPSAWLGRHSAIVAGGIVFPLVVLFALLVYSLLRANALPGGERPALRLD
jgi:cytochrome c oxidase subunit 2